MATARQVKSARSNIPRGGATSPRTSPYEFQGLARKACDYFPKRRRKTIYGHVTKYSEREWKFRCPFRNLQIGRRQGPGIFLITKRRSGKTIC